VEEKVVVEVSIKMHGDYFISNLVFNFIIVYKYFFGGHCTWLHFHSLPLAQLVLSSVIPWCILFHVTRITAFRSFTFGRPSSKPRNELAHPKSEGTVSY